LRFFFSESMFIHIVFERILKSNDFLKKKTRHPLSWNTIILTFYVC
jgi:hypothetical protein